MSGIIIKGALTLHLLLVKSTALALSVGSGLAIGKEGPYIHLVCFERRACVDLGLGPIEGRVWLVDST